MTRSKLRGTISCSIKQISQPVDQQPRIYHLCRGAIGLACYTTDKDVQHPSVPGNRNSVTFLVILSPTLATRDLTSSQTVVTIYVTTAHSLLTGNSQSHHCRHHACYHISTSVRVAVLCSIRREMEDARHPILLSRRLAISRQLDTVFKEKEIIPRIHSIVAGDGEVVSFNNSDSSNRVDGDRLGQ